MSFTKSLFIISLICWLFFSLIKQPLPDESRILPELLHEPTQQSASIPTITKQEKDYLYTIEPIAEYSIQGLVVSSYDSASWYDIYHKNDPGNIKDLCLVWGSNLSNGSYHQVSFSSGQFTCYYSWFGNDPHFNTSAMSNNHLLPATDAIKRAILNTHRGEQVRIEGVLANYTVTKNGQKMVNRHTSLTRDDTGNGACEVLYVTGYEVIRRPLIRISDLKQISFYLMIITGLINTYIFLVTPHRLHQK
jgi:hypothetical protein